MTFSVSTQLKLPSNHLFYEPGFRHVLEVHLPILRNHPDVQRSDVTASELYQFEGDFYGLLNTRGVPIHEHWLITRMNHMENGNQFGQTLHDPYRKAHQFTLLRPPSLFLDQLVKRYRTKNK
jgi:hypothetical protein